MKRTILYFVITLFFININSIFCKNIRAIYQEGKLWTAVDSIGNVVYKSNKILDVEKYSENLLGAYIYNNQGKAISVYLNGNGKVALETPSRLPYNFYNGRAKVVTLNKGDTIGKTAKYGFINRKGNVVVPIEYLDATDFSENLAYVMSLNKRGIIDTNGKFIVIKDSLFAAYYGYANGFIPISTAEKERMGLFGIMDKTGKIILDYTYEELGKFSEGLCKAYKYGKWGYIDAAGDLKINWRFDEAREFREERAFVAQCDSNREKYKWAIIDKDGTLISFYDFDGKIPKYFSEGLAAVKIGEHWKYVNRNAKIAINDDFIYAGTFKNGIAFVVDLNNKKYFIDKQGKKVFELPENVEVVLDCHTNERYGKQ